MVIKVSRDFENDNVKCCMCEAEINIKNTLLPSECLNKHGLKAHRICLECWWNPESGFALENASHRCQGCIKNLSLTQVSNKETELIDLTSDDD
jgi:hypothetical protein